jgi:alkanesulfonate monooxygenase SsuD/methylene tetrahydromethanopterin reductase-like flavin-dependent oxidoreductase (luciferase family)
LLNVAKISEAAKLDFMFMADSPAAAVGDADALARQPTKMNRFEPLSLLSALSVSTDNLGLVATVSTSYYEPYNVARIFASIDHLSGGRVCWNVVTSDHNETGYNFNRDGLDPHALRYERGTEFVDVVFGLWDSFEADALLRDRETGVKAAQPGPQGQAFPGSRTAEYCPLAAGSASHRPSRRLGGRHGACRPHRRNRFQSGVEYRPQSRFLQERQGPDAGLWSRSG